MTGPALSWRLPLHVGENAAAFASRLAALNGVTVGSFLRDMAIAPAELDAGREHAVRRLAEVGGADPDALVHATPRALDRRSWTVLGERVDTRSVLRTYLRYCPSCVRDDISGTSGPLGARPWIRAEWTLDLFHACRLHGKALVACTPTRLRFEPPDHCAAILAENAFLPRHEVEALDVGPSPFQEWAAGRLGLGEARRGGTWLDRTDLCEGAALCEAVGASSLFEPSPRPRGLDGPDRCRARDEGFRILRTGKGALMRMLDRLVRAQEGTRGYWGLRDTYGPVYSHLRTEPPDRAHEALRAILREHALASVPLAPGEEVLGRVVEERSVHTVRSLSVETGVHARSLRRLVGRRGVAEAGGGRLRDHRLTVPPDEARRLVDKLRGAITLPEVRRRTGIPRLHLTALVAEGHLPTAGDTAGIPSAKHRISVPDLDATMARLEAGAEVVEAPSPRQVDAMRARHVAGCTLEVVLERLFDGSIWKGRLPGEFRYSSLLIDADELKRVATTGPARTGLLRHEIPGVAPGLYQTAVTKLIEDRRLVEVLEYSPEARREVLVVPRSSLAGFLGEFVPLGELCRTTGLHHSQVASVLKKAGVRPVLTQARDGLFAYDRAAVRAAEAADPELWRRVVHRRAGG